MQTNNRGYPRIDSNKAFQKAFGPYWSGKIRRDDLFYAAEKIHEHSWTLQQETGIVQSKLKPLVCGNK